MSRPQRVRSQVERFSMPPPKMLAAVNKAKQPRGAKRDRAAAKEDGDQSEGEDDEAGEEDSATSVGKKMSPRPFDGQLTQMDIFLTTSENNKVSSNDSDVVATTYTFHVLVSDVLLCEKLVVCLNKASKDMDRTPSIAEEMISEEKEGSVELLQLSMSLLHQFRQGVRATLGPSRSSKLLSMDARAELSTTNPIIFSRRFHAILVRPFDKEQEECCMFDELYGYRVCKWGRIDFPKLSKVEVEYRDYDDDSESEESEGEEEEERKSADASDQSDSDGKKKKSRSKKSSSDDDSDFDDQNVSEKEEESSEEEEEEEEEASSSDDEEEEEEEDKKKKKTKTKGEKKKKDKKTKSKKVKSSSRDKYVRYEDTDVGKKELKRKHKESEGEEGEESPPSKKARVEEGAKKEDNNDKKMSEDA